MMGWLALQMLLLLHCLLPGENDNNEAAADVALPSLETLILSDCNIGPMESLADVLLGEVGY
jgi:hypothetical protein